jgi:colanic acid/amylovoran biosynthesis glycosyltransferase
VKRVAFLCHQYPVVSETFTIKEVEGLRANGLPVDVVAQRPPPDELPASLRSLEPAEVLAAQPLELRRLARRPALAAKALSLRRLLAAARGAALAARLADQDHVHAQFPLDAATTGLFAAGLSGAGFSFSGHTLHRLDLMREKLAAARFVVVGSDFERAVLCGRYGDEWRDRIHVRRLGVPPRPARESAEPWTVVSVGTLGGKKGHDVLIRAVAELARRGRPVRLEVIGEGPERAALEALLEELGVADRVALPGAREHAETLATVAGAAVFALACVETVDGDHDCLPVALMDAMSLAVPCVTSDAFGIPELIEDGVSGALVPPGDALALADRLEALLVDPASAERLGRTGQDAVREHYDLDRNVGALARLFAEQLE